MTGISTVIATRNRDESLLRCLHSLESQSLRPDEVVIIDSSDDASYLESVSEKFPTLNIFWENTNPHVCMQRNRGIEMARNDFVFICDDDIELHENYLHELKQYLVRNADCVAAAGKLLQQSNEGWVEQYSPRNAVEVLWRFIFQLPIWGDISVIRFNPFLKPIQRWYLKRGNHLSAAGWPVIVNWRGPVMRTTVYALGASLIRKNFLKPYDPVLDPHGIGDNYGVAIEFPPDSIHVLESTYAKHHLNSTNRLPSELAYFRRILALHYFLKKKYNSNRRTIWLIWSLTGNFFYFLVKGKLGYCKASLVAIAKIISFNNPYWIAHLARGRSIEPRF